jgi:hypothetical protein
MNLILTGSPFFAVPLAGRRLARFGTPGNALFAMLLERVFIPCA